MAVVFFDFTLFDHIDEPYITLIFVGNFDFYFIATADKQNSSHN